MFQVQGNFYIVPSLECVGRCQLALVTPTLTTHSASVLTEVITQQSLQIFSLPHLVITRFREINFLDLKLHCSQSYSEDK